MKFESVELFPGAVLRPATSEDVGAIAALEAAKGGAPQQSIEARLLLADHKSLVVTLSGSVVSYAVLKEIDQARVDFLRLSSAAQGQALGPHIVRALKAQLQAQGFRQLLGRCSVGLLPYYQRLGCRAVGTLPGFFGKGEDAFSLLCNL